MDLLNKIVVVLFAVFIVLSVIDFVLSVFIDNYKKALPKKGRDNWCD